MPASVLAVEDGVLPLIGSGTFWPAASRVDRFVEYLAT